MSSSKKDCTATIREDSPRAADWLAVFGAREVALKSPLPRVGNAPGVQDGLFFELDLEALSAEQRERLVAHLARRFDLPVCEVAAILDARGCPILGEDVWVAVANPQRWL